MANVVAHKDRDGDNSNEHNDHDWINSVDLEATITAMFTVRPASVQLVCHRTGTHSNERITWIVVALTVHLETTNSISSVQVLEDAFPLNVLSVGALIVALSGTHSLCLAIPTNAPKLSNRGGSSRGGHLVTSHGYSLQVAHMNSRK